ncbi:HD-GYP domain-containing protein [Pararhizobium gei]|uniref:HD-GYP domain-containing protein n=1 Tax=Pararhizobium gei TaxID=1395951 RepID=UPI0023DA37A6|nr:HD-GYP domain-containing protein [Rhizobium gei]
MLKRIKRHQVRTGMFIADIEGEIPEATAKLCGFVLTSATDVAHVKASSIISLVIDTRKGADTDNADVPPKTATGPKLTNEEVRQAIETLKQTKPLLDNLFSGARGGGAAAFQDADVAVDHVTRSVQENPAALIGITRLKKKDEYTFLHSIAVSAFMVHFGRFLNLEESMVRMLGIGGLLHDIGKMAVPDKVLVKKGPLTGEEMGMIRLHPVRGYEQLLRQGDMPETVLDICLHHHERMDGKGYPKGLQGDQLSLAVRIASICDVYDAMTSVRPYKQAFSPAETIKMMMKSEGQFDRALLREFISSMRGYKRRLDSPVTTAVAESAPKIGHPGEAD